VLLYILKMSNKLLHRILVSEDELFVVAPSSLRSGRGTKSINH